MELKEAYELRGKEVLSLTRKVAKLEKQISGVLPLSEKEDLEHQIRSRDYTITCLKKELRISNSRFDTLKKNYSLK